VTALGGVPPATRGAMDDGGWFDLEPGGTLIEPGLYVIGTFDDGSMKLRREIDHGHQVQTNASTDADECIDDRRS
jgi:hypothetical protein